MTNTLFTSEIEKLLIQNGYNKVFIKKLRRNQKIEILLDFANDLRIKDKIGVDFLFWEK